MKGIVLAGGNGTRLRPMTKVINKHLLPVGGVPMIYYPLRQLAASGIKDVMVVTGGDNPDGFLKLLGNGKHLGLNSLQYVYQEGAGGIAEALSLTETFADEADVVVLLGDNVFQQRVPLLGILRKMKSENTDAAVVLKEVADPERFGVANLNACWPNRILSIVEKPKDPYSKFAVTGYYIYSNRVYDIIKGLSPSERNELEITDVNNAYIEDKQLSWKLIEGWWTDAGTIESLATANRLLAEQPLDKELVL